MKQRIRRRIQPSSSSSTLGDSVIRKFPVPRTINLAFLFIDLQPKTPFKKLNTPRHHPLACLPRLHVNIAFVGISAKPVASRFQKLVPPVQQHVGQQRRKRSALWHAFLPLGNHTIGHQPFFNNATRRCRCLRLTVPLVTSRNGLAPPSSRACWSHNEKKPWVTRLLKRIDFRRRFKPRNQARRWAGQTAVPYMAVDPSSSSIRSS